MCDAIPSIYNPVVYRYALLAPQPFGLPSPGCFTGPPLQDILS